MTKDKFIQTLINHAENIKQEDYFFFLDEIYHNRVHPVEVVAFLSSLSSRNLTRCDMTSFVRYIHSKWPQKHVKGSDVAINIVGTGGGIPTFNISTATTFVASAAGAVIIKSGSPSYTSKSGSLDVLKALGINLHLSFDKFGFMIEELGLGFVNPNFFAPILRKIALSIQPLTIKNIGRFINMTGPFLCPIKVKSQLIGVNSMSLLSLMHDVSHQINSATTYLCFSETGMDEFSSIGKTYVVGEEMKTPSIIDAEELGFVHSHLENLEGGDPRKNASIIVDILKGKITDEKLETVLLNSAFLLKMAEIANDLKEGVEIAQRVIENGTALRKLEQAIKLSNNI